MGLLLHWLDAARRPRRPRVAFAGACFILLLVGAPIVQAASFTMTLQPSSSGTDDSYLEEDDADDSRGSDSDFRIKATPDQKNRNALVRFPLSGLAGKSVLRAWLELRQSAASSSTPMEVRAHELTESWDESVVTWDHRDNFIVLGTPWTMPGGTRNKFWTDRALLSSATNNGPVQWQVGPLVQAWNAGWRTNHGILLEPERGGSDREVQFRSSEYGTAIQRPKLVIHYTDEAPAIREGKAEIQPRTLRVGSIGIPITAWLDVDATAATPSGAATGFDALTITHGGGLVITAVDRFVVAGASVSPALVSWTDDGQTVTFRFPRIRAQGVVQLDFRANVLAAASPSGLPLPMSVDDAATPGAWSQQLWPGDGDRVAGNGDDWIVTVVDDPAVSIDLRPDTATIPNRSCLPLTLSGQDGPGNVFPLIPDSIQVIPRSAGTVGPGLQFCAANAGNVKLIAWYGPLRDTSDVLVEPEKLTRLQSVNLRDRAGASASGLSPGDTMLVDVSLSDGDGLEDVSQLEIDLLHSAAGAPPVAHALGATFSWQRGRAPAWSLDTPLGTSWQVVPALCAFDEASNATTPIVARLALVVGRIARASDSGDWKIVVRATSATPPDVASSIRLGIDALPRLVLTVRDPEAAFSAGLPGATGLPLETPADARLHLAIEANEAYSIEGKGSDLAGVSTPTDTLRTGPPQDGLHWSFNADGSGGGTLGPGWETLESAPAPLNEQPIEPGLRLWIDHPGGLPGQDYVGALGLRLTGVAAPAASAISTPGLRARVVTAGLAAQVMLAEITPHVVTAGTAGQVLTLDLLPLPQGTDTGVDRLRVSMPAGYGTPVVTSVEVAGSPAAFSDLSAAGRAEITLASPVTTSQRIRMRIVLDAPTALDPDGSDFVVTYDDVGTTVPPQTAVQGDANGVADGNSWLVRVVSGPLAGLLVLPPAATMFRDSSLAFTVGGHDALGHPVTVTPSWRVTGGIGTVGAGSGLFVATTPGTGVVIVEAGGFADTSEVRVLPTRAIRILSLLGPSAVHQGQSGVDLLARITNSAPNEVTLDTLALRFSRARPGDADPDFTVVSVPAAPIVLAPGAITTLPFTVDVSVDAILAPLAASLSASGNEAVSGLRLRDVDPDSTLAFDVVAGGIGLTAGQIAGEVRPGDKETLLWTLLAENLYPETRVLRRLSLRNRTQGPGDAEQLDAELGEIGLYTDDGDGVFEPADDQAVLFTSALDGQVTLAPLDEKLPALSTTRFFVTARVPLAARDGDLLDVELADAADVELDAAPVFRNAWPLSPAGGLTVDGMVAAQIKPAAVGPAAMHPGTLDQLAFDVLLPPNGYQADVLTRLGVVNLGTAQAGVDIARLRAWADEGDGSFVPADDRLLGSLVPTGGGRWQLTGMSEPVPVAGLRVFVTADAAIGAAENTSLRLALPAGADPGVGMASGNSGPLDAPVANPSQLTMSDLDRVSLVALPVSGGVARPDDRGRPILRLAVTNNYATPRTLTTLVLDNATTGPGSVSERDGETRLITLRLDADGSGALEDTDPVLASGFFQNGLATFNGLAVSLSPFTSRQLFATLDLSPTGARDGDAVGVTIQGPNSVGFAEPTTVTGPWPLDSGARWAIDGLVASQVTNRGAPAATVGPGDGPVLALDIATPRNGYAADVLRGIRLVNLGTAGSGDLARVQLWRDGGDGIFAGAGDDALLGPLSEGGGSWTSPLLAESIADPGARLFVSFDVAAAATESSTVRFAIPAGGIENDSANDGPVDAPVANAEAVMISRAPLLATLEAPRASVIGQVVPVRMIVRNVGSETVRGISAPALDPSGSATLAPLSGPQPATFDLAPAEADTFAWEYTAQAVGDVRFAGDAGGTGDPSGQPRAAARVSSNLHQVFVATADLELSPVQTMPVRVNRGQHDVVPFSLTLVHPGGANASDVRVDRLSVRLEQESGAAIVPSDLITRVVVNEGTNVYLAKTAIETFGDRIDLSLATPAVVTSTQPATLNLRFDVSDSTVVPTFRVIIDDSTRITAQDATSGAPVTVRLESGSYPLRSQMASVVAEAEGLDLVATAQDSVRAGRGSPGVRLLNFRVDNPGVPGISSNVRLASVGIALTDSAGADRPEPGAVLSEVRILAGTQVVARRTIDAGDPAGLDVFFLPPLELPAGTPLDLALVGDIAAGAPLGRFAARILDSTRVDARDANTRASVPVRMTPVVPRGGPVTIEAPAESLWARGTMAMPTSVVIGQSGVPAFVVVVRHPGPPDTGRLRADSLAIDLLDDLRRPLSPAGYLDRLVLRWGGAEVANITSLPATGPRIRVPLPGLMLEPGDSVRVEVTIDVDASAPAGSIELVVPQGAIHARDANTNAVAQVVPEADGDWPVRSGLGRLTTPARELAVALASLMPAALAADGQSVPAARLTLRNADPSGAGPIEVAHLAVRGSDRALATAAVGALAARLEAWVADTLWAQSAPLSPDSSTALLVGASRLALAPGETATLELRMVTRPQSGMSSLRLGVDRADVGVVQPSSALLAINVRPEPGAAFPFWTEAGGVTDASLAGSYSNFPNPFAAGREPTTVSYFLPGPGRVTLRIYTLRGDLVATLLDGVARPAGLHQDDRWSGRNGRGDVVVNGVYVADLDLRFDDGTGQRLRRKVAVVR